MIAVGLMSGTSLDGVDAALVSIIPKEESYALDLLRFQTFRYDDALREELLAALPPNDGSVAAVAQLHHKLGERFANAAGAVAGTRRVDYVASHGQTIWHEGFTGITLQIGDPFVIRETLQATVVYDFRSADCAAGGQGAPLVPYVDALLLGDANEDRVALNLGGIANVTLLRKGAAPHEVSAFDTGPGNVLIDTFVRHRTSGAQHLDPDGELAKDGTVDQALLYNMLGDEYFSRPAPKTTGRERFGAHFLRRHAPQLDGLSLERGAATLTELTAASVAQAIKRAGFSGARVIVSGGGAHNQTLLERLAAHLPAARVELSNVFGVPADAKEAIAFAVLGYETLRGRSTNVPAATGARRHVVLGAVAPCKLRALLAKLDGEASLASADGSTTTRA